MVYFFQIFISDVMKLSHLFIIEKLSPYLRIQLLYLRVQCLLFLVHTVKAHFQFMNLPLNLRILIAANPFYCIFLYFLNVADSLKDIRDIVDSPFLNLEYIDSDIQINGHILAIFDEIYEFFSQNRQTVILPTTGTLFVSFAVCAHLLFLLLFVQKVFLSFIGYFLSYSFPHKPTNKLTIKIIISRSSYKILYFAQTVKIHSIHLLFIYEQPTQITILTLLSNNNWHWVIQSNLMGNLFFTRRPNPPSKLPDPILIKPQEVVIQQIPKKVYVVTEIYDPQPIFKPISQNKMKAIEKFTVIHDFINSPSWNIKPQIIEHFRILNAFQYIQVSKAQVLQVQLYRNIINNSTIKIQEMNEGEKSLVKSGQNQEKQQSQNPVLQQYSEIYASLFSIQFLSLKKLKISGRDKLHEQSIVSLQVLQYLNSPLLQQLHVNEHNLTSVKFLKKCHWKYLQTLSLRDTKISDSSHFASILPYISNSRHIQTINLQSQMSQNWMEVSWIIKMGFKSAQTETIPFNTDGIYYMNQGRILRRIEFGITKTARLREKHISMIKRKFNNSYFDNPLALW